MSKLNRSKFIKGLALGTLGLPFALRSLGLGKKGIAQGSGKSNFEKTYEWRMVTTWPPDFPVLGEGCNLFAEYVERMSGGRLKIKVYGGGELVPALGAFDAVQSGAAEMGSGVSYYWAGKVPAAQFFASVPFGMNAQQVNAWLISGGGIELWRELYAEHGLVPMVGGNTGVQMGGWFNKEINSLSDLKGLKMRMPGLGGKVLEKAGGSPILLAGNELYTGLERGVIDATEWIGPYHDYKMGFYQIAKYYYSPGWHETGAILEFFFNKELFDKLPDDLKSILEHAAATVNHWMLSEFEAQNAYYLKLMVDKHGVQLRKFPEEVLVSFKSYTKEAIEELVESDAFSKKVYASYSKFQKEMNYWANQTEKPFYNQLMS